MSEAGTSPSGFLIAKRIRPDRGAKPCSSSLNFADRTPLCTLLPDRKLSVCVCVCVSFIHSLVLHRPTSPTYAYNRVLSLLSSLPPHFPLYAFLRYCDPPPPGVVRSRTADRERKRPAVHYANFALDKFSLSFFLSFLFTQR